MEPLTERQQAVLQEILQSLEQEGVPPTTRELGRRLGIDPKSVSQHLDRLERKGFIRRRTGESRNIRLTRKGIKPRGVPLVGQIAAGQPMLAEENLEARVEMEDLFGPRDSFFLLRVQGNSMQVAGMPDAGLCDGDMVAVAPGGEMPRGAIAVVLVDGEATVKRFFPEPPFLRLEPDNPDYDSMRIDTRRTPVKIVGRVTGLIRRIS